MEILTFNTKSLQELCIKKILKSHLCNTIDGCLMLYHHPSININGIGHGYESLKKHIIDKIKSSYPFLVTNYDLSELTKTVIDIDWDILKRDYDQLLASKEKMNIYKGTVIERLPTPCDVTTLSDYYPISALLEGVEWPKNVDPACREKFLNDEDFFTVFKMTKESFYKLYPIKRKELKRQAKLF